MRTLRYLKIYVLALAVTAVAAFGDDASAAWTRTHAFDCFAVSAVTAAPDGAPQTASFGLVNNGTNPMVAHCPISDTDLFPKGSISELNVHGWDGNGVISTTTLDYQPQAMVCRTFWGASGGVCGPITSPSEQTGNYTLQPSRSVWGAGTEADFGYLWVKIPGKTGGSKSVLRGYFTAN